MADKDDNKDDEKRDSKPEEPQPEIDLNAIGKAFVEHYYTLFDSNRLQLSDLYVTFIYNNHHYSFIHLLMHSKIHQC